MFGSISIVSLVSILLGQIISAKAANEPVWNGAPLFSVKQGESVSMSWTVTLSDANKNWTYAKISQVDGINTEPLITFQKSGGKRIDNQAYQSRAADLELSVVQSGKEVKIIFTMKNVQKSTDAKDYRPMLGFKFDSITFPNVTALQIQAMTPNWDGVLSITAVQGESVTMNWNVTDVNSVWTFAKISHVDGVHTEPLLTIKSNGEKQIDNQAYQRRAADLNLIVTKSGSVVKMMFTIRNLQRSTDMKDYKPMLGFQFDSLTYPRVTSLVVNVRPYMTQLSVESTSSPVCVGDTVKIECSAVAFPAATFSIYVDDSLTCTKNARETCTKQLTTTGWYLVRCIPKNIVGIGQSKSKYVSVKGMSICQPNPTTRPTGTNSSDNSTKPNIKGNEAVKPSIDPLAVIALHTIFFALRFKVFE